MMKLNPATTTTTTMKKNKRLNDDDGDDVENDDENDDSNDDLGLRLSSPSKINEEKIKTTDDVIREFKDENSRLFKLLAEKDFESKQLRKKLQKEKDKVAATTSQDKTVGSDLVATKIVELSRRNRELTCELESEKNKSRQQMMKMREYENEIRRLRDGDENRRQTEVEFAENPDDVIKSLKEKLTATNSKLMETKAQLETQKQTTAKTQRALEKEIGGGDGVNLQAILTGNSTWQGRAQKIINLQNKVSDLTSRLQSFEQSSFADSRVKSLGSHLGSDLGSHQMQSRERGYVDDDDEEYEMDDDDDVGGFRKAPSTTTTGSTVAALKRSSGGVGSSSSVAPSSASSTSSFFPTKDPPLAHPPLLPLSSSRRTVNETKQFAAIKKFERKRKEETEKMGEEMRKLGEEKEEMGRKVESMKARIRVLTNELKSSKTQVETLLQKGKHDDELVQALMGQLKSMKEIVDGNNKDKTDRVNSVEKEKKDLEERLKEQKKKIEDMESNLLDRENRIEKLHDEIIRLQKDLIKATTNSGTPPTPPGPKLAPLFDAADLGAVRLPSIFPEASASAPEIGASTPVEKTASPASKKTTTTTTTKTTMAAAARSRSTSRCKSRVDRPLSSNAVAEKTTEQLRVEIQEVRCLGRAAEVERDRLMELLRLSEDRVSTELMEKLELESKLNEANKRLASLEKDLQRQQLKLNRESTSVGEKSSAAGKKPATYAAAAASAAASRRSKPETASSSTRGQHSKSAWDGSGDDVEELETRLAILAEDNEALRRTLEATLSAKKRDLDQMQIVVSQTKDIFLKGMKDFKGG